MLEVGLEFFMNFKIYGTEKLFIIKRAIKIDKKWKLFENNNFRWENIFQFLFFPQLHSALRIVLLTFEILGDAGRTTHSEKYVGDFARYAYLERDERRKKELN